MTRQELISEIMSKQSFLCVGLDTDKRRIPSHLLGESDPLFTFNKAIIDATAELCVAYKPNLAFYEAEGQAGMAAFEKTVRYIKARYPRHFVIADAKRGDIGNTAAMYARTFFGHYDVDALTVAPYMGSDSVRPFLEYGGKWTVVLALTSNAGASDFQFTADAGGERLFERVLRVSRSWGSEANMMYVVGATQADTLADVRRIVPTHFLLVPGVGAQGGSLHDVCVHGMTRDCALIVNSSRGIIYAGGGADYADAARAQAEVLQKAMSSELASLR